MLFKKIAMFRENMADLYVIKMLNVHDIIHINQEKLFCIS